MPLQIPVEDIFQEYNIPYITRGNNVATGNINVKCPFCGDNDPSEHMGINLTTGLWGCWRDQNHRGRDPARLVSVLLGCSRPFARSLLGYTGREENLLSQVYKIFEEPKTGTLHENLSVKLNTVSSYKLKFPNTVFDFDNPAPEAFHDYLIRRNIKLKNILRFCTLKWSVTGSWKWRLIIPVYEDKRLVTWVGRSIKEDPLRYKTLPKRDYSGRPKDTPLAIRTTKQTLLVVTIPIAKIRIPNCHGQGIVVEGPFDLMRLVTFIVERGHHHTPNYNDGSVDIICVFGTGMTSQQFIKFKDLVKEHNISKPKILFDRGAEAQAMRLSVDLSCLVPTKWIACPATDPAAMTDTELCVLLKN